MLARSKVAILLVVAFSSVALFQTVEGACGVHVGVPGAPIQVGSPFVISYYTDVGCNGMTTVLVRPALSVTPIWQAGPGHVSGGLDYEVTAPGINTPGGYFAEVSFVQMGGNTAVLGEKLFQVVGPASASTDWAVQSVSLTPSNPQVGDPVTFSAVLVALSTSGSYPQSVDVECTIDGASCGGGSLSYPGPTGNPATVNTQTPWIATQGTHTLTWSVSTINDPNPGNNVMSTTFTVGSAPAQLMALSVNPPNPAANSTVDFQGTITPSLGSQQKIAVNLYRGSSCTASQGSQFLVSIFGSSDSTGSSYDVSGTLGSSDLSSLGAGTYSVFAHVSLSSPPVTSDCISFTVSPAPVSTQTQAPDFTINVSPPSQSVLQGQMASYSVNVAPLNGFNSQVSLSVSGLPSGANGVFSNPSGTPNFASTLTVTLPGDVAPAVYTLTVTGSGGGLSHVANLVLTVNAAVVTQTSASSTQTSTQTSSDLMSMIQQNQLLILGGIILLAVLIAVALRSRRKPTTTQPTRTGATAGFVFCGKCGTQNPTGNKFCKECGADLK